MGARASQCERCFCRNKPALRRHATRSDRENRILEWERPMKGYIYTMYAGADPGHGWVLNDPIFVPTPTLGACVPNIRRSVQVGDHIFAISGRVAGDRQFIVGG